MAHMIPGFVYGILNRALEMDFTNEILQTHGHKIGLVSRRKKGVIEDTVWHKSFITKSVQYKRDVVPMHITGRCRNYFYNLSNLRKFLGIKANIEMFFLPKETYQHKNNLYHISVGKPIPWEVFDKRYKPLEWAEKVKRHCYSLPGDINRTFTAE